MSSRLVPMLRGIVLCGLVATLPALAQDNGSKRPAPGGQQGGGPPNGGSKPGGGGSGGGRPTPGGGGNKPAPAPKPNPGQGGGGRPNPGGGKPNPGGGNPNPGGGRPNPGGGNAGRPQPPRPQPGRPQPGRPNPGNGGGRPPQGRPPNWGRPPQNRPTWGFRPNNRSYLHQYYFRILANVNRAHRPVFTVGGFFPYAYIGYLTPVPISLYGHIPPPPPGYQMGYYDGYVVVYDPGTYYILDVIDLLQ